MLGICAYHTLFIHSVHLRLQLEHLESRRLLSVSQSDSESSLEVDHAEFGAPEFTVLLNAIIRDDVMRAAEENNPFDGAIHQEEAASPSSAPADPLPAVPIDDSFNPFTDCPGLDSDFCLPGDTDQNGTVDFSDFLRFSDNFGNENATWDDGDFDGDGQVSFADFLILSSTFE